MGFSLIFFGKYGMIREIWECDFWGEREVSDRSCYPVFFFIFWLC